MNTGNRKTLHRTGLTPDGTKKQMEILYSSCLCVGLLLLINAWLPLSSSPALFLAAAFVFQILIRYTEEKKARIPVWGGILFVLFLIGGFLYLRHMDMGTYLSLLKAGLVLAVLSYVCCAAGKRFWLKAPLFLLQAAGLVLFSIRGIGLPKWAVYFVLCSLLLFLTECACLISGKGNAGKTALYLTPVFFAALLFLLPLPVRETPIRWTAVREAIQYIQERAVSLLIDIRYLLDGRDTWSTSFSGYSSDGRLDGRVTVSSRPQISISGANTWSPLYLAGSAHDFYTGTGWEDRAAKKPYKYDGEEAALSCAQSVSFLKDSLTPSEYEALTHSCAYTVTFDGLKTESLFTPLLTERVYLPDKTASTKDSGDVLRLTKAKSVGFSYQVRFLEVHFQSERIKELLRSRQSAVSRPGLPLEERERFIHENYTLLPKALPERVKSLAGRITQDERTDYDRLKAIESWLVDSCTYTTAPPTAPEGTDVIDYFLFEGQKGYCTHFATAMAVLARCVGIPTRYVEGFATTSTCTYDNRTLRLTGRNAHAWPEAYFDGIGWIPFEPTPGYFEPVHTGWTKAKGVAPSANADTAGRPEEPERSEAKPLIVPQGDAFQRASGYFLAGVKRFLLLLLDALLLFALLFVLLYSFSSLRRLRRRKAYLAMNGHEKIRALMGAILGFGKLRGIPLQDGETLSAYAARLSGRLDTVETEFAFLCERFQAVRFGASNTSEKEIAFFERYIRLLQKQYRENCKTGRRLLFLFSPLR